MALRLAQPTSDEEAAKLANSAGGKPVGRRDIGRTGSPTDSKARVRFYSTRVCCKFELECPNCRSLESSVSGAVVGAFVPSAFVSCPSGRPAGGGNK